jgi:alcohol dehydrogenase (cytochrome c)
MFSRTYDAQRVSPLKEINRQNVSRLQESWTKELGKGNLESIPLVHDGVMYLINPGETVQALDATNGSLIWEYKRPNGGAGRPKSLSIYDDMIFYVSPDNYVVAIDAKTGQMRWETPAISEGNTSGSIVVDGVVISGRRCGTSRPNCYIAAHDAKTGKELWKFYVTAGANDPGGDSWFNVPDDKRVASAWSSPGSFDPKSGLVFWGVANPRPYTWLERHGDPAITPKKAPADLYSNSTLALNPKTGKLAWYYQHLPGDEWNMDYGDERTIIRTRINPDARAVKWISTDIPRGQTRDVVLTVGEGGAIFALDPATGKFLWATPFPFDVPELEIADINLKTGQVLPNWEKLGYSKPGDRHVVCFYNPRGYAPTAYHPGQNALFVPFADECIDQSAPGGASQNRVEVVVRRPGSDPKTFGGLAKVNVETGKIDLMYKGQASSNGAVLATAGDVVFWGDLTGTFRAFDAEAGKVLWETNIGAVVQNSTITYAVNGRQYIAVMTGEGLLTGPVIQLSGATPTRNRNSIHVFALPSTVKGQTN